MGVILDILWNHFMHYVFGAIAASFLYLFITRPYKREFYLVILLPVLLGSGFPDYPHILYRLLHLSTEKSILPQFFGGSSVYGFTHYSIGIFFVMPIMVLLVYALSYVFKRKLPENWVLVVALLSLLASISHVLLDRIGF